MVRARSSEVLLLVLLYAVSIVAVLPPTPVLDVTLLVCIMSASIVAWRSYFMPLEWSRKLLLVGDCFPNRA